MFSGTVRTNLDPFGEYGSDDDLWRTVRDVGLEDQVGLLLAPMASTDHS